MYKQVAVFMIIRDVVSESRDECSVIPLDLAVCLWMIDSNGHMFLTTPTDRESE